MISLVFIFDLIKGHRRRFFPWR